MIPKIKIAVAQMNPTVGDLAANTEKIILWIEQAEKKGADLIVFPELALSGYPIWDLANREDFLQAQEKEFQRVVRSSRNKKIAIVLGLVARGSRVRERHRNALAWIEDGKVKTIYHKRLLPTYDVFLENIFFEPGEKPQVVSWKGRKIGLTICEDIWDKTYSEKPVKDSVRLGADFVINISASPYFQGVLSKRLEQLTRHAKAHKVPVLYANLVGAQDDLIFDGRSLFVGPDGKILFQAPRFEEGLFYLNDPEKNPDLLLNSPESTPEEMYEALVLGIRDYCKKNNFQKTVLGLSGGVDSGLVAVLAVDAFGPKAVKALAMPSPYSSRGSWEDAATLAKNLGIEFHIHPITESYETLCRQYQAREKKEKGTKIEKGKITLAMENLQARLRGLELMYLSNHEGLLLLSTGNKSEMAMGYCTLYGDMCGGLAVLGDVYKTDVYKLCDYRNKRSPVIPKSILTKAPSAELRPNQKDQDSLPPYNLLDQILALYIEKKQGVIEIAKALKKSGVTYDLVREVTGKVDHNEYKRRQTPPILRVTEKAWFGRRMPITNHFHGI